MTDQAEYDPPIDPNKVYCETCHNMKHEKDNCPYRLGIGRKEEYPLFPGEFLLLKAPNGKTIEIEHTADTFSVSVGNFVVYDLIKIAGQWRIFWPRGLRESPFDEE